MLLRLLESLHGHFGILAAVALMHPAILLRRGRALSRGMRWSIGLTAAVTATTTPVAGVALPTRPDAVAERVRVTGLAAASCAVRKRNVNVVAPETSG